MSAPELQRQRHAAEVVHDIVSAMRAMAAGRVQGAQRALASARAYHAVVLRALGALDAEHQLPSAPDHAVPDRAAPDHGDIGLLVITSEQGLCGAFNENVLTLAMERRAELQQEGHLHLFVVGRIGGRKLRARGIEPESVQPAATSVRGIRDLVKRVATPLEQQYAAGRLTRLHVIYSAYHSVSQQIPTEVRLLPPDTDAIRAASLGQGGSSFHYLPIPTLLVGLIGEYAFISLYRIAAESYASEQASRLVAMDAATRSTADLLEDLRHRERRAHQHELTRQALELISARFALHT